MSTLRERVVTRKAALTRLGFRVDTKARYRQAVRNFQRAKGLPITGICDPVTHKRLIAARDRNRVGQADLSAHFSFRDFACKCGGRYGECQRIWIRRRMVVRLEKLRGKVGPITLVSGCRCKRYNASISGAPSSRHIVGDAVDLPPKWDASRIIGYRLFTGVGTGGRSGKAMHVDCRPGSVYAPVRWFYPGW